MLQFNPKRRPSAEELLKHPYFAKFHDAKEEGKNEVEIWGTGSPMREFLHVDDLADACLFLMKNYDEEMHINVGTARVLLHRVRQSLADCVKRKVVEVRV